MTAMLVGFEGLLRKCEEEGCNKEAAVQIRGKNYCYEHGKLHINEAVEDNYKSAKKKYSE